MVSFIPHCMNEFLSAKNNGFFEHPALFAMHFRFFSSGKLRIKSIHSGREDPVEDCCEICFLTLQQPLKIKINQTKRTKCCGKMG